MKYFTKEWYTDLMLSNICFQFRKTERAGEYSEKFFEKLYEVEKKAYVRYAKRLARTAGRNFDKCAHEAEFDKNYQTNLEFVRSNLPADILTDIKDIRVLALGSVTNEMAQRITRYCGKKNRLCESVERRYNDASEEIDEQLGEVSHSLLSLIGAAVSSFTEYRGDIRLCALDENGNAVEFTLNDAETVENDDGIVGSSILKYELLPADGGKLEFSILSMGNDSSLHTASFIVSKIS